MLKKTGHSVRGNKNTRSSGSALIVCFAVVIMHQTVQREATPFVAGPELLVFLFPLALAPFVLDAALLFIRRHRIEI